MVTQNTVFTCFQNGFHAKCFPVFLNFQNKPSCTFVNQKPLPSTVYCLNLLILITIPNPDQQT